MNFSMNHMQKHTQTSTHTPTNTNTPMHMHANSHTHVHKHAYTHAHQHTASVAQWLVLLLSERKIVGSNPPMVVHMPCRSPRLAPGYLANACSLYTYHLFSRHAIQSAKLKLWNCLQLVLFGLYLWLSNPFILLYKHWTAPLIAIKVIAKGPKFCKTEINSHRSIWHLIDIKTMKTHMTSNGNSEFIYQNRTS